MNIDRSLKGQKIAALLAAACLGWAAASAAGAGELTVGPDELEQFPLMTDLPGDPPESGLRYWSAPFELIGINGAYVSVIIRNGRYELWHNTWGDELTDRRIVVHRGPDIRRLGKAETAFDSSIVDDVFEPKKPELLSPERGFTRTYMYYEPQIGYVLASCVCPGYYPGSVPLLPAFVMSKTGDPGTWEYKGKLKGDTLTAAAKRTIWSDGGSLHRLDDDRWRIYINGFGPAIAALESDTLDGPWRFRRNDNGKILELLPDDPNGPRKGGPWINVVRARPNEWHLWFSDGWPPQCIWHRWSEDGLDWKVYGRQPEITRMTVGGHAIKCLRAYLDPDGKKIVGLLSVWGQVTEDKRQWLLHVSTMPIGPPPETAEPGE